MGDAAEVTRAATVAATVAEAIGQETVAMETAVVEATVMVMPAVVAMAGEESLASPSAENASAPREARGARHQARRWPVWLRPQRPS